MRVAALVALVVGCVDVETANGQSLSCDEAAEAAEQLDGLPPGLLRAIGRVESGRRAADGGIQAWPWSINGAGVGRQFASRDEASSYLRDLLASGQRVVDVGCFQVDLYYHPDAFAALDDGFEPAANAAAAAGILRSLYAQTGDWKQAIARYHSADPSRGDPYRDAVLAAWNGRPWASAISALEADRVPDPFVVRTSASAIAIRVWTPYADPAGPRASRRGVPRIITP